jgi:hypothetical protein
MRKKRIKIDWIVHAIPEENGKICLHTHGLNKRGLTELSVLDTEDIYTVEEMTAMINNIVCMMIEGEEFIVEPKLLHVIDDVNGKPKFKFRMSYAECYGEKTTRLYFIK